MKRFFRTLGLLALFLFLLSASIGVTLDRIETSPGQNCLAIYDKNGVLQAEYTGNLQQLATVGNVPSANLPLILPRARPARFQIEMRWL